MKNTTSPQRFSSWGFTLIEMVLVSAIIGLLASIALPKFANLLDKAKEAQSKGSIGTLRSALSLYYADTEGLYPMYGVPFNLGGGRMGNTPISLPSNFRLHDISLPTIKAP